MSQLNLFDDYTIPNIRFVKTEEYAMDYNEPTDTVSINISKKYSFDKTYLMLLGMMESCKNPIRGVRPLNSSLLHNTTNPFTSESYEYLVECINCNIGTLILLCYMNKFTKKRLENVYEMIRICGNKCLKIRGKRPKINMLGLYRMCSHFLHDDVGGVNKTRFNRVYLRVCSKLQRDIFDKWED